MNQILEKNETGRFCDDKVKLNIGFPKIGTGLAGGDWKRIEPILIEFSERVKNIANIFVVNYKK